MALSSFILMVHISVKWYKRKHFGVASAQSDNIEHILKSNLTNFVAQLSLILTLSVALTLSVLLNMTEPVQINTYPYYHFALFHQYVLPFAVLGNSVPKI
jgi:hypothetical protein